MARAILSRSLTSLRPHLHPHSILRSAVPAPAPAHRSLSTTSSLCKAAPKIISPVSSVESSVDRLLPPELELGGADLPLDREVARDIVARVLGHLRGMPDVKSVEEARRVEEEFAESIRRDLSSRNLSAASLRQLSTLIVASTSDPRRHPVASNLYCIAFGTDPASLPAVHLDSRDVKGVTSDGSTPQDAWDWQSAYSWASLVLQGRAPPPAGATRLPTAAERSAALAAQNAAAYRVFAHLALRGHPRGIFGMAKHLIATLERSSLGVAAVHAESTSMTRQETVAEVERLYRLAGEGGVEEAWFELGALYAEGKWVRKDDARARAFLDEGVQRDSPRACQTLAQLLTRDANALDAVAGAGGAGATAPPSSLELGGAGAEQSEAAATQRAQLLQRALHLFEQGARLGSAECAFSAGMRYLLQPEARPSEPSDPAATAAAQDDPLANMDLSLDAPSASPKIAREDPDPAAAARRSHLAKWGTPPRTRPPRSGSA